MRPTWVLRQKKNRQKVISAESDWMRLAVIRTQRPPKTFSWYHMKPRGNESLYRLDHEMVCDKTFLAAFLPTDALKIQVMTSQRYASFTFLGTT